MSVWIVELCLVATVVLHAYHILSSVVWLSRGGPHVGREPMFGIPVIHGAS